MRTVLGWVLSALLFCWGLAAPTHAWAEPAALKACRGDAQKLCPAARPGEGQLLGCLRSHADALSAACRDALPALSACGDAVQRLCGDAGAGERRACIARHRSELAHCAGPAR